MEAVDKKPTKKKITLDNLTWKGWIGIASIGGTIGAIIGKFL